MVHRAVLVTPILTHYSILLMVLLIITSTLKHQFGHDVLNTEMKSAGKHSLKNQSFTPYQLFFFLQKSKSFSDYNKCVQNRYSAYISFAHDVLYVLWVL